MQYQQNYIPKNRIWLVIWLASSTGMGVMFLGIMADSNLLAMIGFMGTVMLLVVAFVEKQLITADETGITEKSVPLYPWCLPARNFEKKHPWNSIASYKWDKDFTRSMTERWFLKLNFTTGESLIISQPQDSKLLPAFNALTAGILKTLESKNPALIQDGAVPPIAEPDSETSNEPVREDDPEIYQHDDSQASIEERMKSILKRMNAEPEPKWNPVKEKGFYENPFGKSLSLFFAGFTVMIGIVVANGYGTWTSAFRLLVILVPGSAYMIYRSYFASK